MTERRLRVVCFNAAGLSAGAAAAAAVVRPLNPDIVVVQDGPWRLRWRTPIASLASALGLVYAGGGRDSVGNALLVKIRVEVDSVQPIRFPLVPGRSMRGALVGHCRVGPAGFAVVGARLADDAGERTAQLSILARALAAVTGPLVVCGDLGPFPALNGSLVELVDASAGRLDPGPGQPHGTILTGAGVQVDGFELGPAGPTGYRPAAVDLTLSD